MALLTIPTTLTFNGKALDPKEFKVEHLPDYTIAQRDIQDIHVEGRDGDILIDSESYKNIPRTYSISFGATGPEDFAAHVSEISKWLDCPGYGELHDTYENDYYRLAFPTGSPKVQSILNGRMGKVDIEFSCVPKRFLMYGKNGFDWSATYRQVSVPEYSRGDVNGDGLITFSDAFLALQAAVQLPPWESDWDPTVPGTPAYAADFDGDGVITSADARGIVRAVNGESGERFQLYNPTDYDSRPIIDLSIDSLANDSYIYFCESMWDTVPAFVIKFDKNKLNALATPDQSGLVFIIVDCEKETVYEKNTFVNLNPAVTVTNGFPKLLRRKNNSIEFDGHIFGVTVYPKFWTR